MPVLKPILGQVDGLDPQRDSAFFPIVEFPTGTVLIAFIEFESNTTTIPSPGRATLDQLIALLRRAPHTAIEIGGHTDKYGAPDYNLQLSLRRAEAVRDYFINQGLTNQFTAVGYGATRPLPAAEAQAGFQHNRRIELRVKGVGDL